MRINLRLERGKYNTRRMSPAEWSEMTTTIRRMKGEKKTNDTRTYRDNVKCECIIM